MFQNQWEYGTTLNWVKGRHTLAFGFLWDHTQLNIINENTTTDSVSFRTFPDFVQGVVRTGSDTTSFSGSANRYYRSDTAGAFINDNYKVRSNLTVTLGLRWDFDGPLSEKYGKLAGVQRQPILLRRSHRHDYEFGAGDCEQQCQRHTRRRRYSHEEPSVGVCAAYRYRLESDSKTNRPHRLRYLL